MPAPPESSRGTNRPSAGRPTSSSSGGGEAGSAAPAATKPKPPKAPDPPAPGSQQGPDAACWAFVTVDPERSNPGKGTAVHRAIREQLGGRLAVKYGKPVPVRLLDAAFAPYSDRAGLIIGGKRTGEGYLDLAFRIPLWKDMLLAEIKPANPEGLLNGMAQLENYLEKANLSEEAKKKYQVRRFLALPPEASALGPIFSEGREFVLGWCYPGLILYKEIKAKKDEDEQGKRRSEAQRARSQRQASPEQRATQPALKLQKWTPEQLRRDIEARTLEDGVYRNRYTAAWPTGERTNVVVWVKTGAGARDVQYYQEFPESAGFYERFAARRGLSERQADLIRRTMADYNRDLYTLIVDPQTGRMTGRSPEYARAELRTIYIDRLRGVVAESAVTMVVSGLVSAVSNAMQGLANMGRSLAQEARSIPIREAPSVPVREAPTVPVREMPVVPVRSASPVPVRATTVPGGGSAVVDIPVELLDQIPRGMEAVR
jgi:hypothetical protein